MSIVICLALCCWTAYKDVGWDGKQATHITCARAQCLVGMGGAAICCSSDLFFPEGPDTSLLRN